MFHQCLRVPVSAVHLLEYLRYVLQGTSKQSSGTCLESPDFSDDITKRRWENITLGSECPLFLLHHCELSIIFSYLHTVCSA